MGRRRQGPARGFGLLPEAADPQLAAAARHVRLARGDGGFGPLAPR